MAPATIKWSGGIDGWAEIIDQTLLPEEYRIAQIRNIKSMWQAIKTLQVRGAPAIGIAAAYGAVLGLREPAGEAGPEQIKNQLKKSCDYLRTPRPTAVNLFWALARIEKVAAATDAVNAEKFRERILAEAQAICAEDKATCRAIGRQGADLIRQDSSILTHCNAGGLATADYGTALAVMFTAQEQHKRFQVYVDETRPLLQGARLTAWELVHAGIDTTVICDNMAGLLMRQGKIDLVITGADRIAANGDTANKIGTYPLAVLAQAHNIPFYIAAPSSTFDLSLPDGDKIPIEERAKEEIIKPWGKFIAPENVKVYNPAFDITPHQYISAIITERGVIDRPDTQTIRQWFDGGK